MSNFCGAVRRGHSSSHGRTGDTCRKPAGWGTSHAGENGRPGTGRCRLHGGSTPNHLIAAEVIVAERALQSLGLPIPTDPVEALQRAVDSAAGLHHGLQQLVREAADDAGSRSLLPRLALYSDAVDRLSRVAKQALDAKLTERQATLVERQAAMLVAVTVAAMHAAAIPPELHAPLKKAIAAEVRQYVKPEPPPVH